MQKSSQYKLKTFLDLIRTKNNIKEVLKILDKVRSDLEYDLYSPLNFNEVYCSNFL